MKKQKTFEYETSAVEWLLSLSKCFEIKSAQLTRVEHLNRWKNKVYNWRIEVSYI